MDEEIKKLVAVEIAKILLNGSDSQQIEPAESPPLREEKSEQSQPDNKIEPLREYVQEVFREMQGRDIAPVEKVSSLSPNPPSPSPLPPVNTTDPLTIETIAQMSPADINKNWPEISKILESKSSRNEYKADVHPPVQPSANGGKV